jgi:hypothetical protein
MHMNIQLTIMIALLVSSQSLIANAPAKAESAPRSDGIIIDAWPSKVASDEERKSPPPGAIVYFYVISVVKHGKDGAVYTINLLAWSTTPRRMGQSIRLKKTESVWAARPSRQTDACSRGQDCMAEIAVAQYEILSW